MPVIKVCFGKSEKEYSYCISQGLYELLELGMKIHIRNSEGWDYRGETVTVKAKKLYATHEEWMDLKEIEAFKIPGTSNWISLDSLTIKEQDAVKINDNRKGDKPMKNIFGNLEFGKYTGNQLRVSIKGIAYLNESGNWVVFDKATNGFVNVDEFVFAQGDSANMLYQMPVAINTIVVGDIVKHNNNYVIVQEVSAKGYLNVYDPTTNELRVIMPVRNIFGFDFYTKVISLIDGGVFGTATAENPFGNMLPFLFMSDSKDSDMKDFMLMSMLCGGDTKNFMNNPLMMYMLMGDKGGKDNLLPLMMMTGNGFNNLFAPAAVKVSGETYAKVSDDTCDRTCKH